MIHCSRCENKVKKKDPDKVPSGWIFNGEQALCPDCIPKQRPRKPGITGVMPSIIEPLTPPIMVDPAEQVREHLEKELYKHMGISFGLSSNKMGHQ